MKRLTPKEPRLQPWFRARERERERVNERE